jgi:hypothetical protein
MKINQIVPNVKVPIIELGFIHSKGEFYKLTTSIPIFFELYLDGNKLDIQTVKLPPSPDQITIYSNGQAQLHPSAAGKTLTGNILFQAGFLSPARKNSYQIVNI